MGASYNVFKYHYEHLQKQIRSDSGKLSDVNFAALGVMEEELRKFIPMILEILEEDYLRKEQA